MNLVVQAAFSAIVKFLITNHVFERILESVKKWAMVETENRIRKAGVTADIQKQALGISDSLMNLGIEIAVQMVKRK